MSEIHYINQLDYSHVSYPTTLEPEGELRKPYPSVAKAGCGLCCVCMTVEALTGERLTVEDCIRLSIEAGANRFGTDMGLLGRAVSGRYGLSMTVSDEIGDVEKCLEEGGCVIFNAGKEHGLFSDGGHFLLAAQLENGRIWILDPSDTKEKYSKPEKKSRVKRVEDFILAAPEEVEAECGNRHPAYFLFRGAE